MKKRLLPIIFIAVIFGITITTFLASPVVLGENVLHNLGHPTMMSENLEKYFKANLSAGPQLRSLNLMLRTLAGSVEKNDIFLTQDNGLIARFIPTTDSTVHRKNTRDIISFTLRSSAPTAVMILPTASAIYYEKLPPFAAEIQMNQRSFIEETNKIFSGNALAIDIYPTLFGVRREYIYARTDKSLTTRGGFAVYEALVRRLGFSPKSEQSFSLQFLQSLYYGELYGKWGYGGVKGDTVTAYHYTENDVIFSVHRWLRYEDQVYNSLYPVEAMVSGDVRDIVLGGRAPLITITNAAQSSGSGKLLIFGDSNAMTLLPFLPLHYSEVTFADPTLLTDSELARINPDLYSQVLFTFSLETYMNTAAPARAATAGTDVADEDNFVG